MRNPLHTKKDVLVMIAKAEAELAQVQRSLDSVNDVKEPVFEPSVMILMLSNKKNRLLSKLALARNIA